MIEIIHQGAITRVWQDESLPETAQGILTLEHIIGPGSKSERTLSRVGLEVVRSRHNSSYGLLGAEMLPAGSGQLHLRLPMAVQQPDVSRAMVHGSSIVYGEIPEEYGRAIIDGVTAHPSWPSLGSGVLTFDSAAHDQIGSSYMVFRWLGWGLVQLLLHGHPAATAVELSALLRLETYKNWKLPSGMDPD